MASTNTLNEETLMDELHDPKRCHAAFSKIIEQYSHFAAAEKYEKIYQEALTKN